MLLNDIRLKQASLLRRKRASSGSREGENQPIILRPLFILSLELLTYLLTWLNYSQESEWNFSFCMRAICSKLPFSKYRQN